MILLGVGNGSPTKDKYLNFHCKQNKKIRWGATGFQTLWIEELI